MNDASGTFFANISLCSRKDLRNAVEAAAKIGPGWAARNAYNRRQIPYRLAEMLEARAPEMTFATHAHLRGLSAVGKLEERKTLQIGAADSVKRLKLISAETPTDWFSGKAQGLYEIRDPLEAKTTWHPVGA